jgi:hypothetical protein
MLRKVPTISSIPAASSLNQMLLGVERRKIEA